jgi:ankyrin repeat protein
MAEDQFLWAVKTGDVANVKAAVEKGLNVNTPDKSIKKRTPLHYAADFGQGTFCPVLILIRHPTRPK